MIKGFWERLEKPIVGLSPMDGVTDAPMRFIAKKYGQADVIYTEFVSVEGLWRIKKRGETKHKIWSELEYDKSERPVVAQLFGCDPQSFFEAAKIVSEMGFDGIDINMGCPSPGLERRGGGAGLMRDIHLAREVIEATRRGSEEKNIPVSVKTRIGSSKPDREWWEFLAGMELPAVAMHGRTFKQLYKGEADWESLKEAAKIIRASETLFLANGDIQKMISKNKCVLQAGVEIDISKDFDGVLIGRGAVGNPWVLRKDGYEPTVEEKLGVAVEHARKYEEIFYSKGIVDGSQIKSGMTRVNKDDGVRIRNFFPVRKHLAWYAHGFPLSSGLRRDLVRTNSAEEVENIVMEFVDAGVNQ